MLKGNYERRLKYFKNCHPLIEFLRYIIVLFPLNKPLCSLPEVHHATESRNTEDKIVTCASVTGITHAILWAYNLTHWSGQSPRQILILEAFIRFPGRKYYYKTT